MDANTGEIPDQVDHEPQTPSPEVENHGLFVAVEQGDLEAVQKALKNGADVKAKRELYEETALHTAARFGHEPIIKFLLAKGADFNARDEDDWTLLMSACFGEEQKQSLPVIEFLLEQSKILAKNTQDPSQDTIPTDSSNLKESASKQTSAKNLSYINFANPYGSTALTVACCWSTAEIVRFLLDNQADVDAQEEEWDTPLILAARFGTAKMVEDVLSFKPDIHKVRNSGRSAVHQAIRNDNDDEREGILDILLKSGVSASRKDDEGFTPLHLASDGGYLVIVKKLLEQADVDINAQNDAKETPLHLASRGGYLNVVEHLLSSKEIDLNLRNIGSALPLFSATENNHLEVVQKLLSHTDIDVNDPGPLRWTPLHVACERGHLEIVEILLDAPKIKPNTTDVLGRTPFNLAARENQSKVVQKLLSRTEIDFGAADIWKRTPLHTSSLNGNLEIVDMIINKTKEHINAQDDDGLTPLHLACQNGHMNVARQLFSKGARSRVGSDSSQSAWYCLIQYLSINGDMSKSETQAEPAAQAEPEVHAEPEIHAEPQAHSELREDSASERTPSKPTTADIQFVLDRADKEEKASATALADTDDERDFLAHIMGITKSELVDYELIRFAMSSDPFDIDEIVDRLKDEDVEFYPQPTSALQWAAYCGRHDIVWWLLKNSPLGREAQKDEETAKTIAERRRDQLNQKTQALEGGKGTKEQNLEKTQDKKKEEKGFKLTVDMLTDPPVVEGAHFESYRKLITSDVAQKVLKAHWATIVDFYERDGRVDLLRRQESVFNVIYGKAKPGEEDMGPEGIMNKARTDLGKISVEAAKEKKYEKTDLRMRWIHLPANNMEWMEDLAERIFTDKKVPPSEWFSLNDLLQRSWHELPTDTAPARFMKPVCLKEPAQSLQTIAGKEELNRSGRTLQPIVEKNRRTSTTEEIKESRAQPSAEPPKKTKESRAADQATGSKALSSIDPKFSNSNAQIPVTYERVALYMPYITFGLCHRKPPLICFEKDDETPQKDVGAAGTDERPLARNGKPVAHDDKSQDNDDKSHEIENNSNENAGEASMRNGGNVEKNNKVLDKNGTDRDMDSKALQRYNDLLKSYDQKTIHETRSLDQFFYNSLPERDMDDRDQNQVFTRSFFDARNGDGVPQDQETWPYLAVDQLWLWVIDEETIITSSTHRKDDFHDPVVKRLFIELRKAKLKKNGQPPPSSVKAMSRFIVSFCVDFLHSLKWEDFSQRRPPGFEDPALKHTALSMPIQLLYEERLNSAATKEKNLFHDFKTKMNQAKTKFQKNESSKAAHHEESARNTASHGTHSGHPGRGENSESEHRYNDRNWASISGAADLLDEVKDILDELAILKTLVTRQLDVWKDLVGDDPGSKNARGPAYTLRAVQEMMEMADRVQKSVNDILSLEQNGINIDQAQESARQGTVLMAFTIVTVVFTPLSFLTSLFALNVTSFQHNSSGEIEYEPGWIFPILFCGSTAIIGLLMIYAFRDRYRGMQMDGEKLRQSIVKKWEMMQKEQTQRTGSSGGSGLGHSQKPQDSPV